MTTQKVIEIIMALLFVILTGYIVPALKAYLTDKKDDQLVSLIEQLVTAAEQLYKNYTKSGDKKLEYVKAMLEQHGVAFTDDVRAKVEAAVYKLP